MKMLLDMNLSPAWVAFLMSNGFDSTHWTSIGEATASDSTLMAWARENGYVVVTHDLDFSALLAATRDSGPSVIQLRTQDVLPDAIGDTLIRVLTAHADSIASGAIVTIDAAGERVRVLPLASRT